MSGLVATFALGVQAQAQSLPLDQGVAAGKTYFQVFEEEFNKGTPASVDEALPLCFKDGLAVDTGIRSAVEYYFPESSGFDINWESFHCRLDGTYTVETDTETFDRRYIFPVTIPVQFSGQPEGEFAEIIDSLVPQLKEAQYESRVLPGDDLAVETKHLFPAKCGDGKAVFITASRKVGSDFISKTTYQCEDGPVQGAYYHYSGPWKQAAETPEVEAPVPGSGN